MAESVVCFVIDKLISFLITTEAKISTDLHKEIAYVRDELESIRSFLRDADAKAAREVDMININESSTTWVKQVREAAYHIEDVIDEYLLCIMRKHQERGFIGLLWKAACLAQNLKPAKGMASKIEGMKTLVGDVKDRSERYRFNSTDHGQSNHEKSINSWRWHDPRLASLFIKETEVLGFESARHELISWIVQGRGSSSSKRAVISVVGMGGLGKTTLAKKVYDKVYDNQQVTEHFDCYAWITVSQLYKVKQNTRV